MTDKSWKAWERRVAKLFGGQRRGADYGDMLGGKNDIIVAGFSIECKLLKRPTYQQMFDACVQAESSAENIIDIPIAIVKKNKQGLKDKDALVIMRLETFLGFFG
jgi:hypothetical protein